MELPQGSTCRLNALFQQAPRGPIVHSSLSGIPCHCNLQPITFSWDSLICVDAEWSYGHTKRSPRGLLPKRSVSTSRLGPRLKTQLYQKQTFYSFPPVCSWTAWPDLPVQTCLFFFFFLTSNLQRFSVAQYWVWILAGSISAKYYLSQWKPALWWNLLREDNFCLLKRDPPCRHCTPWPPVKGQVCLAFPWYRFSRQGTIRPISSPTCPGLYQW